jgi:hypothetical protein
MEVSQDNFSLSVMPTRRVADVVVSMSFSLAGDGYTYSQLTHGASCEAKPNGAEATVLAYALYRVISDKISGDPLAVQRSKCGAVLPSYTGNTFGISWSTQGSVSAVRKTLGIALSQLRPAAVYSVYADLMRGLNHTPRREHFEYAADELIASLKKHVRVVVIGKINLPKEGAKAKLSDALETAVRKFNLAPAGKKVKPTPEGSCADDAESSVVVSGWRQAVVHSYLEAQLRGVMVSQSGDRLLLSKKKSSLESALGKLGDKAKVSVYTAAKFGKIGDELVVLYSYLMVSQGLATAHDILDMAKAKPSVSDLTKVIVDAL